MAIRHGRNVAIFINGVDLSGELNAINPTSEQEMGDITTFGHIGYSSYPGLAKDSGTIEAIYNDNEKTVFEGLIQLATGYPAMILFGNTTGQSAYATNEIMLKSNAMKSIVNDVNRASIGFDVDNYPLEACEILRPKYAQTASTDTGSTVTATSSTGAGAAGYLQTFAVSGSTGLTVIIEHASTGVGASYAALITLTATTTGGARGTATGTVKEAVRSYGSLTTGATATYAVAFKRY